MAGTVASIASGVLGSAANSKGDSVSGGNNVSNNNVAPQTETPQINQAEVKEAAKPVEKSDSGSNWQQLAQMAQGLMNTAQGSAPVVSGGNISQNQSVANFRQGHIMADIKKEMKDKLERDGALGFLDMEDNVERVLPGPSEEERNLSRLNKIITGEKRPASHTAKEAGAWATTNVALPLLAAFLKGGSVASKGAKGLKAISETMDSANDFQKASKAAQKSAQKAVKSAEKKVAAKNAKIDKIKNPIVRVLAWAQRNDGDKIALRAAKDDVKNIDTAIKATSKYAPELPKDTVNRLALEEGGKALAGTLGAEKLGEGVDRAVINYGENDKDKDARIDKRAEMSAPRRVWQFLKSLVDMDDLDPSKYPMDLVNNLLIQWNADSNVLEKEQLDRLGDDEKIKLVKDVMKGKYNDYEDVSEAMLENYLRLTNTDEE